MLIFIICLVIITALYFAAVYWGITNTRCDGKAKERQMRVACVGDSITYGMMVKNWFANCYPKALGKLLGQGYHVSNFGVNAHTAMQTGDRPYEKSKSFGASLEYKPDIVLIMFGSNDSKPENWRGSDEYKHQFTKLLDNYCSLPNNPRVILVTPVDPYSKVVDGIETTTYNISKAQIREICQVLKEIQLERNLELIDMNLAAQDHRELFGNDGIHPNNNGAAYIAQVVYDYLSR